MNIAAQCIAGESYIGLGVGVVCLEDPSDLALPAAVPIPIYHTPHTMGIVPIIIQQSPPTPTHPPHSL